MSIIPGSLYIIATPIGNLEDLSTRAVNILGSVDIVLAEDTRHSGYMLHNLNITTPLLAYHDHNEIKQVASIIKHLDDGKTVALVSDAGTPLISDPGYCLVTAAHEKGIRVIPIPGPSALTCALSVAGVATDRFMFEGFLPVKKTARQRYLQSLANESRTLVFYEVPHRIIQSIDDLIDCFGPKRGATLVKELTKIHETIYRSTLLDIKSWLETDESRQKGEFVLLLEGAEKNHPDTAEAIRTLNILLQSLSVKDATSIATELLQGNRNELYQLALQLKDKLKIK